MVFNPEECDATAKKIRGTSWAKKYVTFTGMFDEREFIHIVFFPFYKC